MEYGLTFDVYMGKCQNIYKVDEPNLNRKMIFYGETREDMEKAIREYAPEIIKYNYFSKEEKYYNNLFELLEEEK